MENEATITNKYINPKDVVKYLLYRYSFDGEPITNLKIQKLLYYVYVWDLVINKERCFEEKFQAWPNGPVLPSMYQALKNYGAAPLSTDFLEVDTPTLEEYESKLKGNMGEQLINIIDQVYEKYGIKSAFELVALTHNEAPWIKARQELEVSEKTANEIADEDILSFYGKEQA
jgi:uncharacterized phage-associated protein